MVRSIQSKSERFQFLRKYLHTDNQNLGNLIQAQFDIIKAKLYGTESIREERELRTKAGLIKQAIDKQLFDAAEQREVLFELLHSISTKYDRGILTYSNSSRHKIQLDIGHESLPNQKEFYVSPGFIRENQKVMDGLLNDKTAKEIGLRPTSIFLPLIFPNLYGAMAPLYRERYERLALKAYHKYAKRIQVSFEKSPNDYMEFFNAKGFYFEKQKGKLCIGSIYSKYPISVPLAQKTQTYLELLSNLNKTLDNQIKILDDIRTDGRDNLKNLWSGYLMDIGQYKKAAYLFVLDGVRPNLPLEVLEHHMENGFKETLVAVSKKQIDARRARLIKRGVYALGSLLGGKNAKEEEVFNGFKDELTDYSKYKGRGLSI